MRRRATGMAFHDVILLIRRAYVLEYGKPTFWGRTSCTRDPRVICRSRCLSVFMVKKAVTLYKWMLEVEVLRSCLCLSSKESFHCHFCYYTRLGIFLVIYPVCCAKAFLYMQSSPSLSLSLTPIPSLPKTNIPMSAPTPSITRKTLDQSGLTVSKALSGEPVAHAQTRPARSHMRCCYCCTGQWMLCGMMEIKICSLKCRECGCPSGKHHGETKSSLLILITSKSRLACPIEA